MSIISVVRSFDARKTQKRIDSFTITSSHWKALNYYRINTEYREREKSSWCIENTIAVIRDWTKRVKSNEILKKKKPTTRKSKESKSFQNISLCYPISFHWHILDSFVILLILCVCVCVNMEYTENKYRIAIEKGKKNEQKNRLPFLDGLIGLVISLHHNHILCSHRSPVRSLCQWAALLHFFLTKIK